MLELDFAELKLGESVDKMDPRRLFQYAYEMFKERFGYDLPTDYIKNLSVLKWLKKTYPNDAGKLIKWVFYKYDGVVGTEPFSINLFQSGHKWWIDKELFKMKQELGEVKAKPVIKRTQTTGFLSVKDMLANGVAS